MPAVATAAIWDGSRLIVTDELVVRDPGPGEVQVRVLASGICHSDLNVMDGTSPMIPPVVLGHEGAGVVVALGPGDHHVRPGDTVMVGSMTPCWTCHSCLRARFSSCPQAFGRGGTPFTWQDKPVRVYANVSSFAGLITVQSSQLVATHGLDASAAALIGCAVSTGYGVIRNVAHVAPGDAVVVFGIGGIGVNALQTARLAGAGPIIAVDVNDAKAGIARHFGADLFICPPAGAGAADLIGLVRDAVAEPIDAAVECSGAPAAIDAAVELPGPGGITALVGIPRPGTRANLDVDRLLRGRRVVGSLNGAMDPRRDLPEIVRLAGEGQLDLASQVSRTWPLGEIEAAIAAVRRGEVVRAVLDHSS
jgi:S-(hydroxymethyl)glutathione dehydrogenase / alcohol dehydrogenase